ncbi:hypothetical protein [Bradyrhizobium sp. HKCCYLS20291]|uniref:hypothetical protein n=1 Tax=Bradyrhizobium sp. HKCCYLS20291 TaxID=3420766 RepID=UPI003EBE869E
MESATIGKLVRLVYRLGFPDLDVSQHERTRDARSSPSDNRQTSILASFGYGWDGSLAVGEDPHLNVLFTGSRTKAHASAAIVSQTSRFFDKRRTLNIPVDYGRITDRTQKNNLEKNTIELRAPTHHP